LKTVERKKLVHIIKRCSENNEIKFGTHMI